MRSTRVHAIAVLSLGQVLLASAQECKVLNDVTTTFYGWDDNSPPGAANAIDCGRGKTSDGQPIAGGVGTYEDPISYATATSNNNLKPCSIVYIPALQKYARNEDDCEQCETDWKSGKYHLDFWMGSNQHAGGKDLYNCETGVQAGSVIINNAPSGLPVDPNPLFGDNGCNSKTYTLDNPDSLCSGGTSGSHGNVDLVNNTPTTLSTSVVPTATGGTGQTQRKKTTTTTTETCEWEGHCVGAPCQDYNDCSGQLVCGDDKTCVELSS